MGVIIMSRTRHTAFRDPIVEEMRDIKNRLAQKYNYDVRAMLEDVQKRQASGGRKLIAIAKRKSGLPTV
jgi:hypothetical protein